MQRMIDIVDNDLLPKAEYRTDFIVEFTEFFAKAFLLDILEINKKIRINLNQLRRIIFGLSAAYENRELTISNLRSLKEEQLSLSDINRLIEELKIKVHALLSVKDQENPERFLTTDQWKQLVEKEFKFNSDTLNIAKDLNGNWANNLQLTPLIIKDYIGQYYFGSDIIKESLSRVFYENQFMNLNMHNTKLPKRNILLIGPSGCGKTYIVEKIAEFLNCSFISYDVTKMARTGYVGDKVEDILSILYSKAGSTEKMNNGIIFIDEIDKLAANLQYGSAEVSTTGVQLDLLKFIEGHKYRFNTKGHREYDKGTVNEFDSSSLFIICGGAFEGLNTIIEKRNSYKILGFSNESPENSSSKNEVEVDDLINYGLIKEFAARFHIIIPMPERSADDLYNILANAGDSVLNNYIDYFNTHGCNLIFEDDALWEIAYHAHKQKTGARSLIGIIEKVLPMFEVGNKSIKHFTLTKEMIINKLGYR
jgi:ATP-dependent Clp protease ATP-binding subunit ClpX